MKNLTLGTWLLQALSILERKGWRSPLSKCECLTLDTDIEESVLPGIANILESSSHLETLVITMSPSQNNIKVCLFIIISLIISLRYGKTPLKIGFEFIFM